MRGPPVTEHLGVLDGFGAQSWAPGDDGDVGADMDVEAADQDNALVACLRDLLDGHRIEEIEDHDVAGVTRIRAGGFRGGGPSLEKAVLWRPVQGLARSSPCGGVRAEGA